MDAASRGGNIVIYGDQRLCFGATPDRIVFNAELFEKCARAWIMARSCGGRIRTIPWWVCRIAGRRLAKDRKRAARELEAGQIPEGMNTY